MFELSAAHVTSKFVFRSRIFQRLMLHAPADGYNLSLVPFSGSASFCIVLLVAVNASCPPHIFLSHILIEYFVIVHVLRPLITLWTSLSRLSNLGKSSPPIVVDASP